MCFNIGVHVPLNFKPFAPRKSKIYPTTIATFISNFEPLRKKISLHATSWLAIHLLSLKTTEDRRKNSEHNNYYNFRKFVLQVTTWHETIFDTMGHSPKGLAEISCPFCLVSISVDTHLYNYKFRWHGRKHFFWV